MRKASVLALFTTVLLSLGDTASAAGPVHGAKAAGMGTAFIAIADDPSAIIFNPGGLTQLKGTNIYAGSTAVVISSTYQSPSDQKEDTEFRVFFPPHLYISSDLGTERVVAGLGIYAPFGVGGRKWPDDGLTRYASVESFIGTVSVNPTVAVQVLPFLSIGFGLDYLYARTEAERMIDQSAVGAGDARFRLEADGDGWGYNIGALLSLGDSFRLGLAYRSRIKVDFEGDATLKDIAPALQLLFGAARFETSMRTENTFPEIWSIGIAYVAADRLSVDFDVEWVRWSGFGDAALDLEEEVPGAGFSDIVIPLDWRDSWQYKIGLEYQLRDGLALRGGYAFIKTFVPDHTLEPSNPDADQHNFSIGAGYRIKKWVVDAFYNAGFFENRDVHNAILSGRYESFIHYGGISVGRRL